MKTGELYMSIRNSTTYRVESIGENFRYKEFKHLPSGWQNVDGSMICAADEVVMQEVKLYGKLQVFKQDDVRKAIAAGIMIDVTAKKPNIKPNFNHE